MNAVTQKLIEAAGLGDLIRCRNLLAAGAKVDSEDNEGVSALRSAAANGHEGVCQLLIAAGAEIDAKAASGQSLGSTALHRAATMNRGRVCALLIEHGAKINATDYALQTPLLCAAVMGAIDAVQVLFDRGARIDMPDQSGETAMHWFARWKHEPAKPFFMAANFNSAFVVEKAKHYYLTPFQTAVHYSKYDNAQFMVEHLGERLDQITVDSRTLQKLAGKDRKMQDLLLSLETGKAIRDALTEGGAENSNAVSKPRPSEGPL